MQPHDVSRMTYMISPMINVQMPLLLVSVVLVLSFCQDIATYLCISKYTDLENDIYGISLH